MPFQFNWPSSDFESVIEKRYPTGTTLGDIFKSWFDKPKLTLEDIKSVFSYLPEAGCLSPKLLTSEKAAQLFSSKNLSPEDAMTFAKREVSLALNNLKYAVCGRIAESFGMLEGGRFVDPNDDWQKFVNTLCTDYKLLNTLIVQIESDEYNGYANLFILMLTAGVFKDKERKTVEGMIAHEMGHNFISTELLIHESSEIKSKQDVQDSHIHEHLADALGALLVGRNTMIQSLCAMARTAGVKASLEHPSNLQRIEAICSGQVPIGKGLSVPMESIFGPIVEKDPTGEFRLKINRSREEIKSVRTNIRKLLNNSGQDIDMDNCSGLPARTTPDIVAQILKL